MNEEQFLIENLKKNEPYFNPDDKRTISAIIRGYIEIRKRARIPRRFINDFLHNLDWGKYQNQKKKFYNYVNKDGFNKGIVLFGHAGNLMTGCAVTILKINLIKGHSGLFINEGELLDIWNKKDINESDYKLLELAHNRHVLVLNEAGLGYYPEWIKSKFFHLFNTRYNELLKTIIVTEKPVKDEKTNLFKDCYDRAGSNNIKEKILSTCEQISFSEKR